MEKKVRATAVVTVTLQVRLEQPWQGSATVQQIHDTAGREAIESVQRALKENRAICIVGEPKVRQVYTVEEE